MNVDISHWLVKLGWSSYDDGATWNRKYDAPNMSLSMLDAFEFEMTRLVAFHRSCFICPDCGYKVNPTEFIDEEFYNVIQQQTQESRDRFNEDGTTRVERHTLTRKPYPSIELRKIHGVWQMKTHTSSNGDEHWSTINLPEETILNQIKMYGEEK